MAIAASTAAAGLAIVSHIDAAPVDEPGAPIPTNGIRPSEQSVFQAALRDNDHPVAALLRNIVDGVITVDTHGIIESFNPGAERIFGYAEKEALGRNISFLMPEPDRSEHDSYIEQYVETGKAPIIGTCREVTGRRKDGTIFPLELGIGEANVAGDRLFIATLHDLTRRTRLKDDRQQAQKLEALGHLACSVAHDFNNLLMPIITITEVSRDRLSPDDPLRSELKTVLAAAKHGAKLSQRILDFGRPRPDDFRAIDLSTVVEEALSLLRPTTPSNIEIQWRSEAGPSVVMADSTQIHQVLMNLVSNAIDAIGTKTGVISVALKFVTIAANDQRPTETMPTGDFVRLSVGDTGRGIEACRIERIFEPFYTDKPEGSGTGLGLMAVHGIVAAHGGAIVASSEIDRGTTFDVYLPVAKSAATTNNRI